MIKKPQALFWFDMTVCYFKNFISFFAPNLFCSTRCNDEIFRRSSVLLAPLVVTTMLPLSLPARWIAV